MAFRARKVYGTFEKDPWARTENSWSAIKSSRDKAPKNKKETILDRLVDEGTATDDESLLLTKKLGDQVKADFLQIALKFAAYQKEQNDYELISKNAKTVETLASSMSSMTSAVMNLSKEVSSHAKGI